MRIEVILTEELFRRFTVFDLFRRRKVWKGPAIWAAILCACGGICLYMSHVRGASLLGFVLMLVGIGLPLSHFGNFAASMKRQILAMGLKRPQHVYTLVLTDKAKGIAVSNDREKADYEWKIVHHVYRDVLATYLYRTGFSSKGGNHYGKASAIGVVLVALCLLVTAIINRIFKTDNYEM